MFFYRILHAASNELGFIECVGKVLVHFAKYVGGTNFGIILTLSTLNASQIINGQYYLFHFFLFNSTILIFNYNILQILYTKLVFKQHLLESYILNAKCSFVLMSPLSDVEIATKNSVKSIFPLWSTFKFQFGIELFVSNLWNSKYFTSNNLNTSELNFSVLPRGKNS